MPDLDPFFIFKTDVRTDYSISNVLKIHTLPDGQKIAVLTNFKSDRRYDTTDAKKCKKRGVFCEIDGFLERTFESSRISASRAQQTVKEYALNNRFDYFVTLTFDRKKIDRWNDHAVIDAMKKWLKAQRRKDKNFYYISVAERHKDNAMHFHLLIGNYCGSLTDTGLLNSKGRKIYNLDEWLLGFSTAVKIDDTKGSAVAVANYIIKYMSKRFDDVPLNQKRYWCSKGLKKARKVYNVDIDTLGAPDEIFETEHCSFYTYSYNDDNTPSVLEQMSD